MEAARDKPERPIDEKAPAPVIDSTKTARRRGAAKKAPATRQVPAKKKAAAKKSAAKKPVAKKAPAKKPAAKKKVSAAKAPAKKTVAKKAVPRKVPRAQAVAGGSSPRKLAICVSITEEMINDIFPFFLGVGIPIDPLETTLSVPGVGEVAARLSLTITGARCDLRSDDGGRVRVVVSAAGEVSTASAEDGASDGVGLGMAVPANPPAPIPVLCEALVTPVLELGPDGVVSAGLDLRQAEFISAGTDQTAPAPDGVEPDAWAGIVGVFGVLLGGLGQGLFDSLGDHVGDASIELDSSVGSILRQLGVAPGRADISVSSGLLTIALGATEEVHGTAQPVPIAGKRIGLGLAESTVAQLAQELLHRATGEISLPFELDVSLGEQQVGGRLKNTRVLPDAFPDFRTALRTEVRTRLLRGQLELSIQAAWLELPKVLPSVFNQFSKRVGSLAALAPLRVKFPAIIQVPLPDTDDTIGVQIDDLRVTTDGIGLVASLA